MYNENRLMKLEDLVFIKDMYLVTDYIWTKDFKFKVIYFALAKKYRDKEYEVTIIDINWVKEYMYSKKELKQFLKEIDIYLIN